LDIFLPKKKSSVDRAKAFLWLIFHYLESPTAQNPFDDDWSQQNSGKIPLIRTLTDAEFDLENVDTPEETEWGKKMTDQRNSFLKKIVTNNTDAAPTPIPQSWLSFLLSPPPC